MSDSSGQMVLWSLAAGVSESLVSQIERNRVSPAIDTLLALADALDIDLEYLFEEAGVKVQRVRKIQEGHPNVLDLLSDGSVQLVINTTEGAQALADSRSLRRAALLHKVPYYTTLAGAMAAAEAIVAYAAGDLTVRTLQSYFPDVA